MLVITATAKLTAPYSQKDLYIWFLTPLYSIPQVCVAHASWDCITVRTLNEELETFTRDAWREATSPTGIDQKSTSGPIASCNMESFHRNPTRNADIRIHAVQFSPGEQVSPLLGTSIAISPTCGVAITGAVTGYGLSTLLKVVFCRIKGLYERITQIEQYFDSWDANMLSDAEEVGRWEVQLSKFHRGTSCSISRVFSTRDSLNSGNSSSSADDWQEQLKTVFIVRVTHLHTYTYPWDSSQLVHVFALLGMMGFDLYKSGPRADISLKRNGSNEWIEFRRRGDSEQDDSAQDDSVQGDTPITRQMNNQISLISELHYSADLLSDFVARGAIRKKTNLSDRLVEGDAPGAKHGRNSSVQIHQYAVRRQIGVATTARTFLSGPTYYMVYIFNATFPLVDEPTPVQIVLNITLIVV
ncbi:1578_t:CDS:2 [Paraglomus occultum]|uniref:1578_t:CDS:1 n=1 Tax=Paraglomus occultum TaxID=144539 RepID=A0A9N9CFC3_9GLOM|nr:1578_t:CDS:2 [Paraglomus occultum]